MVVGALIDLGGSQRMLEWGWLGITAGNLVVLAVVLLLFAVGLAGRLKVRTDQ